jgi:hypothetical protein
VKVEAWVINERVPRTTWRPRSLREPNSPIIFPQHFHRVLEAELSGSIEEVCEQIYHLAGMSTGDVAVVHTEESGRLPYAAAPFGFERLPLLDFE